MIRRSAVAGTFYPNNPRTLRKQVTELFSLGKKAPCQAVGAMVPHAGYVYSGSTAAKTYASLRPADHYFIIGPNHSGRGEPVALYPAGEWETPLGKVSVNSVLTQAVLDACPFATCDARAHEKEHSLEVQLPFLQVLGSPFSIVPIVLGTHQMPVLIRLGEALAEIMQHTASTCMILASSDMNHFASLDRNRLLDQTALAPLLAMDAEGLMETVEAEDISMCGVCAAVVMVVAAQCLGATQAELIDYSTSADALGETERVVGYAGVRICQSVKSGE